MKSTKSILTISVSVILSLMFLSITITILAYKNNLSNIDTIVTSNNKKAQYITQMRSHARERTLKIQRMLIYTDPFERDDLWIIFKSHAGKFINVRRKLLKLKLSPSELEDIKTLTQLASRNRDIQNKITELILSDNDPLARKLLIEKSIPLQDEVFKNMSVILDSIEKETTQASIQSTEEFTKTVFSIFILVAITIIISILISKFLIYRITKTEKQLFREKERAQVTLYSIGDGAITTDAAGNIEHMNDAAVEITGYTAQKSIGESLVDFFKLGNQDNNKSIKEILTNVVNQGAVSVSKPDSILIKKDCELAIEYTLAPIFNDDKTVSGTILIFRDVSELRSLSLQLIYQAQHDELTGLLNRREFERKIKDVLFEVRRNPEIKHWLVYIDLDQFKVVNDTCGHLAGDELLKQISTTIKQTLREIDHFSRLGGDEFAIILKDGNHELVNIVVERILKNINDFRFCWEDKCFSISASIGLIEITDDAGTMYDLMSKVDAACYLAKDEGRNRIHFSAREDEAINKKRGEMDWVHRIRHALDTHRFALYYQPIKSLQNNDSEFHAEMLIRLYDDEGNIIPPNAFIPAAERYNLMIEIDHWVVNNALKFIKANDFDSQTISINLSAQSLCEKNFSDEIIKSLNEYEVDPSNVCFEITETAAIANLTQAKLFIHRLREIGCKFSLDDFGSGLSSFGYLKNLNVDYLKIDGSFIKNITHDKIDLAMVNAINQVGHTMGLKTIAEYVENKEIEDMLLTLNIDYAQGYGIQKPEPITKLLKKK